MLTRAKRLFSAMPASLQRESREEREAKHWETTMARISGDPAIDYYVDRFLKPGYQAWQFIAQALTRNPSLTLNIDIPSTLVVNGMNSFVWIRYCPKMKSVIAHGEQQVGLGEFEASIVQNADPRYRNLDHYFLLQKTQGDKSSELQKSVFTKSGWEARRTTSGAPDNQCMLQQYIYPKSTKASSVRLCYKSSSYSGLDCTSAFKITNKLILHGDDTKIPAVQMATPCKDLPFSFEVTQLSQAALALFIPTAEKLVRFLSEQSRQRITEAVLDFVVDYKGKPRLIGIKNLKTEILAGTNIDQFGELQSTSRNPADLSCSVFCKLCGLVFKKDDASKVLTFKLLWEFCQHLKNRGKKMTQIDFTHNSTRKCRVCDLCYMAVVAEYELIELEQKFALWQNIPLKDLHLKVPHPGPAKSRPALLAENLKQWRLIFMLRHIQFETSSASASEFLSQNSEIYLQMRLCSYRSCFKVKVERTRNGDFYFVPLRILRLHYFFSEVEDISEFLQNTELQFRITKTTQWSDALCQGSAKTLSHFDKRKESGQKSEGTIYLFTVGTETVTLKMTCGIVCDGEYNTGSLNLYRHSCVFFPDIDFYNCNVFPPEWMEIFDDFRPLGRDENEEVLNELKYTPFCTKNELKKMFDGRLLSHKSVKSSYSNFSHLKKESQPLIDTSKLPRQFSAYVHPDRPPMEVSRFYSAAAANNQKRALYESRDNRENRENSLPESVLRLSVAKKQARDEELKGINVEDELLKIKEKYGT